MADSTRIEELRRRVQLDPASIAFAALAEEYRRAGQYEEAIATCQDGLQRHPAYLSARVTLGRALLELGRFDEAREQLEHVLRVAPENLAAIRGLAEIHHRVRDLPDMVEPAHAPAGAPAGPVAEPGGPETPAVAAASPAPAPGELVAAAESAIPPAPPVIPRKVRLSTLELEPTASAPSFPAIPAGPEPPAQAPDRQVETPAAGATDPDLAALPALEALLAAIRQAGSSAGRPSPSRR